MKCCKYDHDGDGNCHIHAAPGVMRPTSASLMVNVTADRVAWFTEYRRRNRTWGVFPGLATERYDVAADGGNRESWEVSTRQAAEWFDRLSPAQRKRLHVRVLEELDTIRPGASR